MDPTVRPKRRRRLLVIGLYFAGATAILFSVILLFIVHNPWRPDNFLAALGGLALIVGVRGYPWFRRKTRAGWGRAARIGLAAGMVGAGLAFAGFVAATLCAGRAEPPPGRDAVIVLGAGLWGHRITTTLRARLERGLAYARADDRTLIVVSGGQGRDETLSEAAAMAAYLEQRGFPPERILLEDRSTSTYENFRFSRELLDRHFGGTPYTAAYATQRFHLPRAAYHARQAGFADIAGLASATQWYFLPRFYLREFAAWGRHLLFPRDGEAGKP